MDELKEEAFDVGLGVLVVVLDVNLELSVFLLLFRTLLVFDPGGNGQIAVELKFSQEKMGGEVFFDDILSAPGAEEILSDHIKAGLLNFVDFAPEHGGLFHFALDLDFDSGVVESVEEELELVDLGFVGAVPKFQIDLGSVEADFAGHIDALLN